MILPLFYWSTSRGSDLDWIISRMQVIPPERQQEVADQYIRLYGNSCHSGDRKAANTYLNTEAKKYK